MSEDKKLICQSCGMPMEARDFGSNQDGTQNQEYCRHCFQVGKFTDENISFEDYLEKQVKIARDKFDIAEAEARKMATETLPKLKRWQKQTPNKNIILLIVGLTMGLAFGVLFFVFQEKTGGCTDCVSSGDDDGFPVAVFIPIWIAAFTPIIVAQQKNKQVEISKNKKIILFSLLLGTAVLVLLTFLFMTRAS